MSKNIFYHFKSFDKNFSNIDLSIKQTSYLTIFYLGVVGAFGYSVLTAREQEITDDSTYKYTVGGFSQLMLVTNDKTHYSMNNNIFFWKWDNIEDWHNIKYGKKYFITYFGYRIPVLGLFPTIVQVKQLDKVKLLDKEPVQLDLPLTELKTNDITSIYDLLLFI